MGGLRVGLLAVLTTLVSIGAWGDGGFFPPTGIEGDNRVASTEQKAIIIAMPGGDEVLLLQTTYHGPAGEFAWVIPVPAEPRPDGVFLASQDFIDEALYATKPLIVTEIDYAEHHYSDGMILEGAAPPAESAPTSGSTTATSGWVPAVQ